MLTDIGSSASIVGTVISLLGFGFALLQLSRLRGETRAAREATEETQRLFRRELTIADLTRLRERIQGLMELHRNGEGTRALDRYREIWEMFIQIRRRHPNLSNEQRNQITRAVDTIADMQHQVEVLDGQAIPRELSQSFNSELLKLQSVLLAEIEESLEHP